MLKIEMDTKRVVATLGALTEAGKFLYIYGVRYNTYYAMYVHEDLQVYHPNGQAKFLEDPARLLLHKFTENIRKAIMSKKSVDKANFNNAVMLLEASLVLVPIDTGRLFRSGRVVMGVHK